MKGQDMSALRTGLVIVLICLILACSLIIFGYSKTTTSPSQIASPWQFRSIDTMKESRDQAQAKLEDLSYDGEIETEMVNIANTGATHVAIATPYDDQFLPILKRWVAAARRQHLKVWFRGNFSSWEGWFGYPKQMTFAEHTQKTVAFIKAHPELFENGDVFTGCPECENGAQGDPRQTGNVDAYRQFLVQEHKQADLAFASIGKSVNTSFASMNKDVADLVMNPATAQALGGYVTIDHYVSNPAQLASDVDDLATKTGAKVVLGEFGAPIPDLNGDMTAEEQAQWLDAALKGLIKSNDLYGLSYWTNKSGSTALWKDDNTPTPAVSVLTQYYSPVQMYGSVENELGNSIGKVVIEANGKQYQGNGQYLIPIYGEQTVTFKADGYQDQTVDVSKGPSEIKKDVTFVKQNPNMFYSLWASLRKLFFH